MKRISEESVQQRTDKMPLELTATVYVKMKNNPYY